MDDFIGHPLRITCQQWLQEITLAFGTLLLTQDVRVGHSLVLVQMDERAQGQVEREDVCGRKESLQHVILDQPLFL